MAVRHPPILLAAEVKIQLHLTRSRGKEVAIRRVFLFDRKSGLMLEGQTAFVDHEFGNNPPNTQVVVLRELAFLHEWTLLRASRDPKWIHPEQRIANGQMAMSRSEVLDYSRWCKNQVSTLTSARYAEAGSTNTKSIPIGNPVDLSTSNRKLLYSCRYLVWLTQLLIAETNVDDIKNFEPASVLVDRLKREFHRKLSSEKKYIPPQSLTVQQARDLRKLVNSTGSSPIEVRDHLIVRLLLEGLRPGELLKVKTYDVDDGFEIDFGRRVAILNVLRRPNDPDDARLHEPAVKTLPGRLPISQKLATDLISYVIVQRRDAVACRSCVEETPYLFISHFGKTIGQAVSQRNLNRIVAKFKCLLSLPKTLSPRTMRHTHMTEIESISAKRGDSTSKSRKILLQRGRWAKNSDMPAHYTERETMRQSADLVAERDRILYASED